MKQRALSAIALAGLALVVMPAAANEAHAQHVQGSYPNMARATCVNLAARLASLRADCSPD